MRETEIKGVHAINWNENRKTRSMGEGSPVICLGHVGEKRPCFVHFRMEEGQTSPPHAHSGWACTVVLEGSWKVGGVEQKAGEMYLVEPGVEYGPFEPGPDGVVGIEFFSDEESTAPIWDESDPRVVELYESMGGDFSQLSYP